MALTTKEKSKWERGIKLATKYANDNGWVVIYNFSSSNESYADYSAGKIVINSRHPLRVKYYILLHELGHAMEMSSSYYISPVSMHGPRYNTLVYKVEKVKEEFDAWDEGFRIAIDNHWPMDDYFYVVRAKYISTYMIWANNRKHPHAKYSRRKQFTKSNNTDTDTDTSTNSETGRIGDVQGLPQNQDIRSNGDSDLIIEQVNKK